MLPGRSVLHGFVVLTVSLSLLLSLAPSSAWAISGRKLLAPTGAASNDFFGQAVAAAGDFNADGHPDVIVGAHFSSGNAGRAYLYLGPSLGSPLVVTGAAGEELGYSVASAGDFNRDGFDDVIVGAPAIGGLGHAYIFYGGPLPNTVADLTLTGEASGDNFGNSVAAAGDINGDGFDDVVVGAPFAVASGAGRAYVFYGGAVPNSVADITLSGAAVSDNFGCSVSGAGDFNGDGYDDVIIGAVLGNSGGVDFGNALVFYGGLVANSTPDLTLVGEADQDHFGISVSRAGDMNGDGYPDIIVGAPQNGFGGINAGRAYVYLGGP